MSGRFAVYLAVGVSLGVIAAYLLAGGASYEPLQAADPCEPRPADVLDERGVFEGIVLSALDGAACELGVSREELTAALTDEESLNAFAEERNLSEDEIDVAVRAGLLRAVDDAIGEGNLTGPVATTTRLIAENLPVSAALDLFRSLPGDPSLNDVLEAAAEAGVQFEQLRDQFGDLLDGIDPSRLPDLFGDELGVPDLPDDLGLPPLPEDLQLPDGLQLPGGP